MYINDHEESLFSSLNLSTSTYDTAFLEYFFYNSTNLFSFIVIYLSLASPVFPWNLLFWGTSENAFSLL